MPEAVENDALREKIARRAYARFCERGGAHGNDVADWLGAEREVLAEENHRTEVPTIELVGGTRRIRRNRR